jgi:hypothetical protein
MAVHMDVRTQVGRWVGTYWLVGWLEQQQQQQQYEAWETGIVQYNKSPPASLPCAPLPGLALT